MIVFPHAKVNLGLSVLAQNEDGYHAVESIMYPIALCDCLEILAAPEGVNKDEFSYSGIAIPGDAADNLCTKALAMLRLEQNVPFVRVHLHKIIPIGAGLGGGSSDAAYFIRALNDLFGLSLTDEQVIAHCRKLGTDCAFFTQKAPAFATGRGEVLHTVADKLLGYHMALVQPSIAISTVWAYSRVSPSVKKIDMLSRYNSGCAMWRVDLVNDFESAVFAEWPEIGLVKERMYAQGAIYASLSGTGSAVFGIFKSKPKLRTALGTSFYWEGRL